jgi:hypothetical protein
MSRRKPLPLESPNWWPIKDALKHHTQQRTGSVLIAREDFNQRLKAGEFRSLLRRAGGHRELLAASAWDDFHIPLGIPVVPPDREPFLLLPPWIVSSRKLGKPPRYHWFYVWLPDYKNIFGDLPAKSSSFAQLQEVPEKRGRKASHAWPEIGVELVRRVVKKGKSAGNKSTNSWARELAQWCEDRYQKAPADSDLRDFIDNVLRALRIERK